MDTCKICNGALEKIFDKLVLNKYPADYLKCTHCGFIQTSEPVWIEEAYSNAITSLDLGLLSRNLQFSKEVSDIIDACFPEAKLMLDYAGGYGVFVRLMRDLGFNFLRQDPYCENIFTKHFDISDGKETQFDLVTAFEVFEHFVNPLEEIEKIFKYSDQIIFSTLLVPEEQTDLKDWWYIAPETGQHVAFYSKTALRLIAKKFGKNYYSRGSHMHVFTTRQFNDDQIDYAFNSKHYRKYLFGLIKQKIDFHVQRTSLIEKDVEHVKSIINS